MAPKISTYKFIEKASEIYGHTYDYSSVNYINGNTKVDIICKIHGIFQRKPTDFTSKKYICPLCMKDILKQKKIKKFIKDAQKIHGDRYDYSLIHDYTSVNEKVIIICKLHGKFKQKPNNHIGGKQNCKKCSNVLLSINNRFTNED